MSVGFLGSTQLPPTVMNGTAAFDRIYARLFNPADPANYFANDEIFRPGQLRLTQQDSGGLVQSSSVAAPVPSSTPALATTLSPWWLVALIVLLFLIF